MFVLIFSNNINKTRKWNFVDKVHLIVVHLSASLEGYHLVIKGHNSKDHPNLWWKESNRFVFHNLNNKVNPLTGNRNFRSRQIQSQSYWSPKSKKFHNQTTQLEKGIQKHPQDQVGHHQIHLQGSVNLLHAHPRNRPQQITKPFLGNSTLHWNIFVDCHYFDSWMAWCIDLKYSSIQNLFLLRPNRPPQEPPVRTARTPPRKPEPPVQKQVR